MLQNLISKQISIRKIFYINNGRNGNGVLINSVNTNRLYGNSFQNNINVSDTIEKMVKDKAVACTEYDSKTGQSVYVTKDGDKLVLDKDYNLLQAEKDVDDSNKEAFNNAQKEELPWYKKLWEGAKGVVTKGVGGILKAFKEHPIMTVGITALSIAGIVALNAIPVVGQIASGCLLAGLGIFGAAKAVKGGVQNIKEANEAEKHGNYLRAKQEYQEIGGDTFNLGLSVWGAASGVKMAANGVRAAQAASRNAKSVAEMSVNTADDAANVADDAANVAGSKASSASKQSKVSYIKDANGEGEITIGKQTITRQKAAQDSITIKADGSEFEQVMVRQENGEIINIRQLRKAGAKKPHKIIDTHTAGAEDVAKYERWHKVFDSLQESSTPYEAETTANFYKVQNIEVLDDLKGLTLEELDDVLNFQSANNTGLNNQFASSDDYIRAVKEYAKRYKRGETTDTAQVRANMNRISEETANGIDSHVSQFDIVGAEGNKRVTGIHDAKFFKKIFKAAKRSKGKDAADVSELLKQYGFDVGEGGNASVTSSSDGIILKIKRAVQNNGKTEYELCDFKINKGTISNEYHISSYNSVKGGWNSPTIKTVMPIKRLKAVIREIKTRNYDADIALPMSKRATTVIKSNEQYYTMFMDGDNLTLFPVSEGYIKHMPVNKEYIQFDVSKIPELVTRGQRILKTNAEISTALNLEKELLES